MKALVIGSGGREHALAWRLSSDQRVARVLAVPGNPGMAAVADLVNAPLRPDDLAALAEREKVELTVVGPELPLSQGVVDVFRRRGLPIVGPTQAAAALETSKAFAKAFMARHQIPTATYRVCDTQGSALETIDSAALGWPLVIKADGLAAGKGVVIAADAVSARGAVTAMMRDLRFGAAGARVVLEECLGGPEVSFFVLTDGFRAVPIGTAQDHKRAHDDDRGPNTGGMGAFAPSPLCDAALQEQLMREIVEPVLAGMREEGCPYTGFLYCGLMLTPAGPKVIEFNVRFGDPEAQVVLPLLEGELADTFRSAAEGRLPAAPQLRLANPCSVGVVLASGGYPEAYETGRAISGIAEAESIPGALVFHAGTARRGADVVTAGGRVLTVVGRGPDFATARAIAYEAASHVRFDGLHFRRDIGLKALQPRQ